MFDWPSRCSRGITCVGETDARCLRDDEWHGARLSRANKRQRVSRTPHFSNDEIVIDVDTRFLNGLNPKWEIFDFPLFVFFLDVIIIITFYCEGLVNEIYVLIFSATEREKRKL